VDNGGQQLRSGSRLLCDLGAVRYELVFKLTPLLLSETLVTLIPVTLLEASIGKVFNGVMTVTSP
jgi:hypothetical protein